MSKQLKNNKKEYIFFYPGNINEKTGGYIYQKNIFDYVKKKKLPIKFYSLSKNFPNPTIKNLEDLMKVIKIKDKGANLIFDGLVLEGIEKIIDKLKSYKIIALIHHPLYLEYRGNKSLKFFTKAKNIYNKINHFIVTSSETKKLLIKIFKIKSSKITIVEPGIKKFKKYKKIKNNNINLITCGSLIERKKYDYLLSETKNINNIIINIVGDSSRESQYSDNIFKYIKKNSLQKKVILHGKVSQNKLEKLYSQSDFYISTSIYEGFGMSLANASMSNLPIISYKTDTIKKTVGNKGVLFFNNFKPGTLKNLIVLNCFDSVKYKKLKLNTSSNQFLSTHQSAFQFIKALSNA